MTTQSYSTIKNETLTEVLAPTLATITSPKINQVVYPGDDTAASTDGGQIITLSGSGFMSGASVQVDGSTIGVVSVVDSETVTFVSPAKSTGSYTVYLINSDGGTAIYIPGIQYSGTPTWSTSAGSLGTIYETDTINYTLSASSDSNVTYAVGSGTLVAGGTLDSATGSITGTANLVNSSTTYTFGVDAIDEELQDTRRTFSITVNPDTVTWNSPNEGTTYANYVGDVFSISLDATSAMNSGITYSANSLPSGLTIGTANIFGTFSAVSDSSSLITATTTSGTNKSATRTLNWNITELQPQTSGWFGGGGGGSSVYRIYYDNDLTVASVRGPLSASGMYMAASGNDVYGWFAGGNPVTNISRIVYGADTDTAATRSYLPVSLWEFGMTGNKDYGWAGGGYSSATSPSNPFGLNSTVYRLTYSTDTTNPTSRGTLTRQTSGVVATGNMNYGWWGGGYVYPATPATLSNTWRVDYSADTGTYPTRGNFPTVIYRSAATGNDNYGWWGSGSIAPYTQSIVYRVSYASDSSTASTRGPLTLVMYKSAATGSSSYGWWGGGWSFTPGGAQNIPVSTVNRIDYANDTSTASLRSPLPNTKYGHGATGGYPG